MTHKSKTKMKTPNQIVYQGKKVETDMINKNYLDKKQYKSPVGRKMSLATHLRVVEKGEIAISKMSQARD